MPDVTITLKTIDQSSATVKKVNQEFKSLAPGLEKATGSLGKFVSANAGLLSVMGGVVAGAFAVGKAVYASAKEWENAAKIGAKLEAVLKSTGGAAGQSVDGLNKMADSLAMINGLDDELVKNGEALLLTFTKIKGEGFEPTMQAAIDMAAVLGGDLNGSIIQVGKAMNDFSGYTALKRAGVSFTEEQIKQINHFKETNDLVGYQNLLLKELQTEFGGAAQAMTEAGLGGERVSLAFGNLKEAVGGANAGWIQDFNRGLSYTTQGLADWVQGMNDAKAATESNKAAYIALGNVMGKGAAAQQAWLKNFEAFDAQMRRGAATTEYYAARFPDLIGGLKQTGEAADVTTYALDGMAGSLDEISNRNAAIISDAITIQDSNDKYQESQKEILDTIAELQAKKSEMGAWEKDNIAEINEKIEEQKEKYKEGIKAFGEAQAEKLTMLALEKIAMQDGVAGYSEAEAAKAKLLLDTANIAEESAFRQALAFDQAANAIANGTMAADELNKLLTMMSEHGWSIDVAVNVQKSIDIGSGVGTQTAAQQGAGWQGGFWRGGKGGRGAGIPWLAGGGSSGAAVVGDRQGGGWVDGVSELVFGNFTVVPSGKSKKLLQSGALGKVPGFAFGGDMGGYTSAPPITPVYTPSMPRVAPSKSGGGSDPISSAMQFVETQAVDMQASTQSAVVQMAQVTQQMTQSILNSNAQTQEDLQRIASILLHENPNAVGAAVAMKAALKSA